MEIYFYQQFPLSETFWKLLFSFGRHESAFSKPISADECMSRLLLTATHLSRHISAEIRRRTAICWLQVSLITAALSIFARVVKEEALCKLVLTQSHHQNFEASGSHVDFVLRTFETNRSGSGSHHHNRPFVFYRNWSWNFFRRRKKSIEKSFNRCRGKTEFLSTPQCDLHENLWVVISRGIWMSFAIQKSPHHENKFGESDFC